MAQLNRNAEYSGRR